MIEAFDYEAERIAGEAEEERIARENEAQEAKLVAREYKARARKRTQSIDFEDEDIARPCRLMRGSNNRNRLLRREDLNGRNAAADHFDEIVRAITTDLGGPGQLSTIEQQLVEVFAGAAVSLSHLNALLLAGYTLDTKFLVMYNLVSNTLTRAAGRLGTKRVPKEITTPSLNRILAEGDNFKLGPDGDYQITTIEADDGA
jgi:hypothetical protein